MNNKSTTILYFVASRGFGGESLPSFYQDMDIQDSSMREKLEREGVGNRRRETFAREKRHPSREDDEGWIQVSGRSRKTVCTFFFTHFPDNFNAEAMWGVFKKYGNVKEVVIPDKRNKAGMRFGFARFWDVSDLQDMERKLDNIIIGRLKLHANIPRFQKEYLSQAPKGVPAHGGRRNLQLDSSKEVRQKGRNKEMGGVRRETRPDLEGENTYRNALLGCNHAADRSAGDLNKNTGSSAVTKRKVGFVETVDQWLRDSLVGKLRKLEMLNNVQEAFFLEGMHLVRVRYLGDNLVLITG